MAARSKTGLSKVRRYWPGRVPDWTAAGATVHDDDEEAHRRLVPSPEEKNVEGNSSSLSSSYRRHYVRQKPDIVSAVATGHGESEEEDDDAREERRTRIRERALLLRRQEEQQLEEEEEEAAAAESEYDKMDSDSDHEEQIGAGGSVDTTVVVPLFVPKSQRETIGIEEEELRRRRRLEEDLNQKRLEDRKVQTRQILLEIIKKEELTGNTASTDEAINSECVETDDEDEVNQAQEHESWKRRELARIKRSREQSGIDDHDQISQVMDPPKKKIKKQMRFMQRYYHMGCFFQENADDATQSAGTCEIYQRDFSGPTGVDRMDMSILPKVMQVKRFGRRGGTKWTHLLNEDTTYQRNISDSFVPFGSCAC